MKIYDIPKIFYNFVKYYSPISSLNDNESCIQPTSRIWNDIRSRDNNLLLWKKWVKYPKYSLYWQKQTDMDSKEILDSIDEFFRTADEAALAEARAAISVEIEDDISLELSYYSDAKI